MPVWTDPIRHQIHFVADDLAKETYCGAVESKLPLSYFNHYDPEGVLSEDYRQRQERLTGWVRYLCPACVRMGELRALWPLPEFPTWVAT